MLIASLPPLIAGCAGAGGASPTGSGVGLSGGGGALLLCAEGSGEVHVRDARSGASLLRVPVRPPTTELRACAVGAGSVTGSTRTLLTLTGFHDVMLHELQSGRRLSSPALGPSLGLSGWLARIASCALAPDDSALIGLSVSRHGGTGLFLIRLEDVAPVEEFL